MPRRNPPARTEICRVSAASAAEYEAAFPPTSAANPRYYLGYVDDGKWYYTVLLMRTGRHVFAAGRGGVARSPRHETLHDDLACWVGDPCQRGADHGWTQCSNQITTGYTYSSELIAERDAQLDRYMARWRRGLLIVTDGNIYQDGKKVGVMAKR